MSQILVDRRILSHILKYILTVGIIFCIMYILKKSIVKDAIRRRKLSYTMMYLTCKVTDFIR